MGWRDWDNYPRTQRRPADGIKAQGTGGKRWWAGRWIAALERIIDGGRLSRGRSYARSGQVLKLDVGPEGVKAPVQGSQVKPYQVSIRFKRLTDAAWEQVIDGMAAEAIFAAKLLSGEMPPQIEEVFRAAGSSLFPAVSGDLQTDCSCPDWANPCKHVAAVHYLLGERFDNDPWLMFELRGRTKEQIAEGLRARRAAALPAAAPAAEATPEESPAPPLAGLLATFWTAPPDTPLPAAGSLQAPRLDAVPIKRLGVPPFWRSSRDFTELLETTYRAASTHALGLIVDEDE
jgi:uncharacterized Zn finger protein